jgi:hypothetical protein
MSMVIFHSYVQLPEGIAWISWVILELRKCILGPSKKAMDQPGYVKKITRCINEKNQSCAPIGWESI